MTDGRWYVRLTDGREFGWRRGSRGRNPLQAIPTLDAGDEWRLDIRELRSEYPRDPDDRNYVLVPKEEVDTVFFEAYQ